MTDVEKMQQPDSPQKIIPRMGIPCCITKVTDIHTQNMYTYCLPTVRTVTRTRIDVTFIRTLPVVLCT